MTSTIESTPAALGFILELLAAIDGELTSRSRVIDALLDLRNMAEPGTTFQIRVDELLASVPGLTTVPNGWWTDRLEELRDTAL